MSNTQTRIFIEVEPELQQLLNDNRLSIEEILRQHNIPADIGYGEFPDGAGETSTRTKDPALIIFTSAILVLAVGSAISQVLRTLQRRPQLVEWYELVELRDANGNLLLDKKGAPKYKRVKRFELLEPRAEDTNRALQTSLNSEGEIVIKFSSAEVQSGLHGK